jgi:hypothetical protein
MGGHGVSILTKIEQRFPYRGLKSWSLTWAIAFIVGQLLWFSSRFVRQWDVLEIPMTVVFFPIAMFIDPYNGMVNDRNVFFYALGYWLVLYFVALGLSRKRMNPAIPGLLLLLLPGIASVIYTYVFVDHNPIE